MAPSLPFQDYIFHIGNQKIIIVWIKEKMSSLMHLQVFQRWISIISFSFHTLQLEELLTSAMNI